MDLNANMVCDQPDDPLAIGGRHCHARFGNPFAQTVDPQPPVGVEHHFDDDRVVKPIGNRAPKRRPQHPRTARRTFGPDRDDAHIGLA